MTRTAPSAAKRRAALAALADGLRGVPPRDGDWMSLLESANRALMTPYLHRALKAAGATLPDDATAFLEMIAAINDERNGKLRTMALEAVATLNGAGVTPIYLKGMALWATCDPTASSFPRMMSDVDLLVRPQEADRAVDALLAAGFNLLERWAPGPHVLAEFWREGDVGILDLHALPPGGPALTAAFDRERDVVLAPWPGAALIPKPAHQIYLTCLHDLFHDNGFWHGSFDVRHLCDIAELSRAQRIDWDALAAAPTTRLASNAIRSELIAARRIAGAAVPARIARGLTARLHYLRHRAQYLHPRAVVALAVVGAAVEALNLRGRFDCLREAVWSLHKGEVPLNRL